MSKISCKLFGVPQITKDGQNVFLLYSKINALLYYMLVTKVASRDEVAGLLWPDEDERVAKKNLRNAIYQTKKSLGEDLFLSSQKSFLILNESLDIEVDVDRFLQSPKENLHLYTGDFLQGFYLKEAEGYEDWVIRMRTLYEQKFTSECFMKSQEDIQNKQYDNVEDHIRRLIEVDEFDERNFRLLMRLFQDTGRSGKAIETYYDLSKLLHKELGIAPDKKTREIYEQALESISVDTDRGSTPASFFFGRYPEIAALQKALKAFEQKKDCKSVFITGEYGVGKSTLMQKILEESGGRFFRIEVQCYQGEQEISLRPWSRMVRTLNQYLRQEGLTPPDQWRELMCDIFPDFEENLPSRRFLLPEERMTLSAAAHTIAELLHWLAKREQVILIFEDLQWIDTDSLSVLTAALLETDPEDVMLLATCGSERRWQVKDAMVMLGRRCGTLTVQLERFSIEACHHFIEEALPEHKLTGEILERLYHETEGNPFLLNEYIGLLKRGESLDQMPAAMVEVLQGRFLYLSQEELDFVNTLSFFQSEVLFSVFLSVIEKDQEEGLVWLEALVDRQILAARETAEGIELSFAHPKLREYLYKIQPSFKKKLLHEKIGLTLERVLDSSHWDAKLNTELIYHFSEAGNYLKALKYQIDTLNHCLNFSHEMFPVLNTIEEEENVGVYMSREQISKLFHDLESSFDRVQATERRSPELDRMEMEFFYMKGRYLIREGSYDDGLENILKVIEKARQIGNRDYMLRGYKQMTLYHLQVNNLGEMEEYIERTLNLAVQCNYHKEIGVSLRLKGLCSMMAGDFQAAERLLSESINTLGVTEMMARRYATNIAAAHNYIGEIRMAEGRYSEAMELFCRAISLCEGEKVASSLSYFYINAGKAAYCQEDMSTAKEYFNKAYALYGEFDSLWRRPVLDAYMALAFVREENFEEALYHLVVARKHLEAIKDPSELGTVFFAEALIRRLCDQRPEVKRIFGAYLNSGEDYYCRLALEHLNPYCNRYEIQKLKPEREDPATEPVK